MQIKISHNIKQYELAKFSKHHRQVAYLIVKRDIDNYLQLLLERAQLYSKRRFKSRAELRAMGHPYSKRFPRFKKRSDRYTKRQRYNNLSSRKKDIPAAYFINYQSGKFYTGWRIITSRGFGLNSIGGELVNNTDHANFIEAGGSPNSNMIKRPIISKVESDVNKKHNLALTIKRHLEARLPDVFKN